MKKRLLVFSLALVLLLALLCACDTGDNGDAPHVHSYDQKNIGEAYQKSAATATAPAEYYFSCKCGEKSELTFTFGETLGEEKPPHTHTYDQKNVAEKYQKNAATATAPAEYYFSCQCGEKGELTFTFGEALGGGETGGEDAHVYRNEWSYDNDSHWRACIDLSCDSRANLAAHSFGAWIVDKVATCTAEGLRHHTCTVCGKSVSETLPIQPSAHNYAISWSDNGTHHWKKCQNHGCTSVIEEGTHTFGAWEVDAEPTCTAEGLRHQTCTVCGKSVSETIPVDTTAHSYDSEWTTDTTHHWHACLNAGCDSVADKAEHTYYEGSCCDACAYVPNARLTVTFKYVDPQGNPMYVQGEDNVSSKDVKVNWGREGKNTILGNITAFENYVITGWDTDGDGVADDGLKAVKKNMVVYSVVREKVEFDVTLLKQDGSEFAKIKVKEGNSVPKDNRPVEMGKYFKGWVLYTANSASTPDLVCDNCSFKPIYGVADGTIGKVASGAIELDGRRDEEYNTSGAYLPVNTMTQADGRYQDWTVKDVEHGGTRAVPNVAADTWIVWDGNYIYMIIEVADNTLTDRGAAYIAKGLDAWCNDGVELWYTFEQVFENGYNDTRVGIDSMGTGTYALARKNGIGKGRSTHYDEIRYAVRNSLAGDTGSDLSRTGYADNAKTVRKASYIIEYRLPAWTEGKADVANHPDINKNTGLLAGRNPDSNNKNDYAFTSGEKLVAGDVVRFNLQIDDLMILQAQKTGATGTYYWDCPPDNKIPTFLYSNIMLYETDGHGNITAEADLTGKFSACGHTNNYTQYYIMFSLGDTAEAQTKIYGLSGHASGWEGVDTRKFYANKECTVEYIRP